MRRCGGRALPASSSLSRRYGWLYHLRGPLRVARNLVLERRSEETALRRFDWLYRHAGRTELEGQAGAFALDETRRRRPTPTATSPASTASFTMASCSASANASKPMKKLMVKPMPHSSATP